MAEIVFLGTSGYIPTPERDNASFLLRTGATAVLVDCPGSPLRKLASAGVDPLDVGEVFITHVHPDHVYGLPSLVHGLMLREHVLRVHGSAESVDLCRRLLDLFGLHGRPAAARGSSSRATPRPTGRCSTRPAAPTSWSTTAARRRGSSSAIPSSGPSTRAPWTWGL